MQEEVEEVIVRAAIRMIVAPLSASLDVVRILDRAPEGNAYLLPVG